MECTILFDCGTGETVVVSWILLILTGFLIHFKRLQVTIKLSLSITLINPESQSFHVLCFIYGQIYVAFTFKQNLFVLPTLIRSIFLKVP